MSEAVAPEIVEQIRSDVLRDAGWRPGRRIEVGPLEVHLRSYGYHIDPAVIRLLEEYGLLTLSISRMLAKTGNAEALALPVVISPFSCTGHPYGNELAAAWRKPNADVTFIGHILKRAACVVAHINILPFISGHYDGGRVYSLESGECAIVRLDWSTMFVCDTFSKMLDFIISPARCPAREIILEEDEAANAELRRLNLWLI